MSVDKLVDSTQLDSDLTSVANAIRTKGGTSAQMAFPAGFVSAVQNIPTGITPTGTKQINITQNGTTMEDVTNYADAEITVNVSGGGGGLTLLASGTHVQSADATSVLTIPVTYTGTPKFVGVVLKNDPYTALGHGVASVRLFSLPEQELSDIFTDGMFNVRCKNTSDTLVYQNNAASYGLTISESAITLPKPGSAYPWKAGSYDWFIYG